MTLKEKYYTLSEREQRLVLITAAVVAIAIFYWGIWQPLTSGVEKEQAHNDAQQSLLLWVQEQGSRAQQLRRSGNIQTFSGSLPQAVNNTSARHNIAIARMQPQNEELQVTVDEAPFNDVLNWLKTMEEMGIRIIQLDIAESNEPGMVRIRRLQLGK
ncbi:type II secretion system protein GspM [Aestuariibacter sp. A3R04]|uniref:type II secretion system protein GspM n=1 Tax=Aestuariibacter sp. A3R04 TaxID=2841571 RepID=UPI001C090E66|nr:type II secretion system protein M [Aestuariibacter sp. A3R04]MBU3020353.1 type II secretion system protein M [Aestuariibacter sp. A3R04]